MMNPAAKESTVGDVSKVDKGPPLPSQDVPARTTLARISNVVNPIVEAYDKLASAAKILSTGISSKRVVDRVEVVVQINKDLTAVEQASGDQLQEGNVVINNGKYPSVKAINLESKLPHSLDETEKLELDLQVTNTGNA